MGKILQLTKGEIDSHGTKESYRISKLWNYFGTWTVYFGRHWKFS